MPDCSIVRRSPSRSSICGLPAEQVASAGYVGLALLGVVDGQRLVDDLRARLGHLEHGLGELQQRELVGVADVDRRVDIGLGKADDAADQVVDVTEAARLLAVAEDGQRRSWSAWRRKVGIARPSWARIRGP